jgi:type I restriction enzyme M protein
VRLLKDGGRAAVVLPDGSLFGDGVKMRVKEQLLKECNLHTVIRLPNSVFKPYAGIGTNLLFFEKGSPTKDVWYYQHVVPPTQKAYSKTKPIKREYLNDIAEWWGGSERLDRIENQFAWKVDIQTIIDRGFNLDINNPNVIEKS